LATHAALCARSAQQRKPIQVRLASDNSARLFSVFNYQS
jgi:hypothetical protein